MQKKFLVRHIGNMGDMVFIVPPILETLKNKYANCHITFVTSWGYKEVGWSRLAVKRLGGLGGMSWAPKHDRDYKWGKRNMGGHSLHLMTDDPHVDQLVHWHDSKLSLNEKICFENGRSYPTWSKQYYEQQVKSGQFDGVYEMDFGIGLHENPIQRAYQIINLPEENYSDYKLYLTDEEVSVAREVMREIPRPIIVLIEGIDGITTRGWDVEKVETLKLMLKNKYGVHPYYFGSRNVPYYAGRRLTLKENIATLKFCDVGIGVMSGPMHFAAAVGLPTLSLYGDGLLHRTVPAYFLNEYIKEEKRWHRTILGPAPSRENMSLLKGESAASSLTKHERSDQYYRHWTKPGKQATKSCLSVITADEVMMVLEEMLR